MESNKTHSKKNQPPETHHKLKEMQNTINNNVQEINRNIIHIDTSSNFRTPYLHTAVKINVPIKKAGTRKR